MEHRAAAAAGDAGNGALDTLPATGLVRNGIGVVIRLVDRRTHRLGVVRILCQLLQPRGNPAGFEK
jgi:hypothetical protein